jgi:hypothetical protein
VPDPTTIQKFSRTVTCAGECGTSATLVEPPATRPLLRAAAALVGIVSLHLEGWEQWRGKWWCRPCRTRRRLLKAVQ